jgi:hypothetical protein
MTKGKRKENQQIESASKRKYNEEGRIRQRIQEGRSVYLPVTAAEIVNLNHGSFSTDRPLYLAGIFNR